MSSGQSRQGGDKITRYPSQGEFQYKHRHSNMQRTQSSRYDREMIQGRGPAQQRSSENSLSLPDISSIDLKKRVSEIMAMTMPVYPDSSLDIPSKTYYEMSRECSEDLLASIERFATAIKEAAPVLGASPYMSKSYKSAHSIQGDLESRSSFVKFIDSDASLPQNLLHPYM